ncbi:MAG: ABC transporter ATP-binding protein [Terrimicrobiaceae bacterium]
MSAVFTKGLVKKYGSLTVLHGLDLDIARGELFALLGPNGSGKTTLFRILTTLISPDAGTAKVGGSDVVREAAAVRSKIGVVFQSPSLDKKLSARENLLYGGALYGLHGAPLRQRITELAASLRLEEKIDSLVETLSGGQQRRVEIAKCLLTRPEILLLDEPSTGLDPSARMDLWALIGNLRSSQGMTVVFTSHLMDESARADRVGILSAGRLVSVEAPADLLASAGPEILRVVTTDVPAVGEFLHSKCGLDPHSLEGEVRASANEAHAVAVRLTAEMPSVILSTTISKPTLEDVFLFKTGQRLNE